MRFALLGMMVLLGAPAGAGADDEPDTGARIPVLRPVEIDAYGPGHHSDATGRPVRYGTDSGERVYGPVREDVFGPGVHADQVGRPVIVTPE